MGLAVQPVSNWVGDPARIVDYQVRFTRPVLVDGATGAEVTITATVGALDEETQIARIDLTAKYNDETVLGKAQVRVTLA
jgi:acyl dehydratase